MLDIKSMTMDELKASVSALGGQGFRTKQIYEWLHRHLATSFDQMSNLPKSLVHKFSQSCELKGCAIEQKLVSKIDETAKYLFRLNDGEMVETVLMRYKHGNSVCVSTQVGCRMGCTFCASTKAGFIRNLTASEILEQVYAVTRDIAERVSNVVLMGIGEPLDNYDNVVRFLHLLSCPEGLNISLRHVSLSTCGLVPMINELATKDLGLTLSISLHAPNNAVRSQTMPINKRYPIDELLTACRAYANKTSRRISFEYALIQGVNDSKADALELAAKLKGMLCHVNLIPVNEIRENSYKKTSKENSIAFQNQLMKCGINTTIRRTLGSDINAACGQLRAENNTNA